MGALHKGHLSLVRKCAAENNITIVSIFVNPTQFNESSDFTAYPRNPRKDIDLLASSGTDVVFLPSVEEMYEANQDLLQIDLGTLDQSMEGAHRPGHFKGVITIVDKFLALINPDNAYFGLKDYQQFVIIRLLAKQRYPKINIVACPIEREPSGLAMSSRNELLTEEQKVEAALISATLFELQKNWRLVPFSQLLANAEVAFSNSMLNLEYLIVADANSLVPLTDYPDTGAGACIAARCGNVRLIDNIQVPA
jgi:pantoate--beta-alanine ligase